MDLEIVQRNTIVGIMSILLIQNMVLKVLYFGELLYNIDIVSVIFIVTTTHVNLLKKLSLYHKNTISLFSQLWKKEDEFVAAQMKT